MEFEYHRRWMVIGLMAALIGLLAWFASSYVELGNCGTPTATGTPVTCPVGTMMPTQYYSQAYKGACKGCWPTPTSNVTTWATQFFATQSFSTPNRTATEEARLTITPGQTQIPTQTVTPIPTQTSTPTPVTPTAVGTPSGLFASVKEFPATRMCTETWYANQSNPCAVPWFDDGSGILQNRWYLLGWYTVDHRSDKHLFTFNSNGSQLAHYDYNNTSHMGGAVNISYFTDATGNALISGLWGEYLTEYSVSIVGSFDPNVIYGSFILTQAFARNSGCVGGCYNNFATVWVYGRYGTYISDPSLETPTPTPTPTIAPCSVMHPVKDVLAANAPADWWKMLVEGEADGIYEAEITGVDVRFEFKVDLERVSTIEFIGTLSGGWNIDIYNSAGEAIVHEYLPDSYIDLDYHPLFEQISSIVLSHDNYDANTAYLSLDVVKTDGCPITAGVIECSEPVLQNPNPPPLVGIGNINIGPAVCNRIVSPGTIPVGWLISAAQALNVDFFDALGDITWPGMTFCVRQIPTPILNMLGINIPVDGILYAIAFFMIIRAILANGTGA